MFTIPRKNLIESDEGFSVEIVGPNRLEYREGAVRMSVDIELLAGPSGLIVYSDSLRSNQDGDALAERERVISNIRRAFSYRGFDIQVL